MDESVRTEDEVKCLPNNFTKKLVKDDKGDESDANESIPLRKKSCHSRSASGTMRTLELLAAEQMDNIVKSCEEKLEQMDKIVKKAEEKLENAERQVRKVLTEAWNVCHFHHLPQWLQDNDFLHKGHRPPLESFKECFWSIFRMHSETGNIWTHMIGCLIFIILAIYVLFFSPHPLKWLDKLIFGSFFLTAIVCLGLSSCYHTVSCHSQRIGQLFSRLDYCGIALLITGSFIPWLYYGFYCDPFPKMFYLILVSSLGALTTFVSLAEKFGQPHFRHIRAAVFVSFGLSGLFPGIHWIISQKIQLFSIVSLRYTLVCLIMMAFLYLLGAALYAFRIPERFFPGKCDYWFQSHQLFHIFVIIAAMVHYFGVYEMALYRLENHMQCEAPSTFVSDIRATIN